MSQDTTREPIDDPALPTQAGEVLAIDSKPDAWITTVQQIAAVSPSMMPPIHAVLRYACRTEDNCQPA